MEYAPQFNPNSFTPAGGPLPSLADLTKAITQPEVVPPVVGALQAQQPAPKYSTPPPVELWRTGRTNPRTTLAKATLAGERDELTFVLDIWEQATTRTAGRKLRLYMKRQVDRLGETWTCKALAMAQASHQKLGVGLVERFRTLCDDVVPDLAAQDEERRQVVQEAMQDRLQAQWEADTPKREAAMEARREAAEEAKRQAREEMEALLGKPERPMKVSNPTMPYTRKMKPVSIFDGME